MASYTNRSRYHVSVPRHPELYREFSFTDADAAAAYFEELKAGELNAKLGQYEDAIEVRIRTRGYRELHFTASSYQEAELAAGRIEGERKGGLFIDYTKSMNVTLAQLIRKYIIEECPKHKGCEIETYKLNALLVDSGDKPVTRAEQHRGHYLPATERATGRQMRDTMVNLEWLHRPFALLQPTEIEEFIRDRLQSVSPATVDRELDHLSSVINLAIKTWRYNVHISPMAGVRRPRYFNERDRRLKPGEEERLLATAREEDRLRSIELRLEELMVGARAEAAALGSASSRKRAIGKARAELLPEAEATYEHIALYETFIKFLLMTAARRGEALTLVWDNVLTEERHVFFPETKNGRPRKVPLRKELIEALESLPRTDRRVFPITVDQLRDVWERICTRAQIEDFHIHDCRHEGLSRIAETGKFTLVDLQAISGHRDTRMLLRYAHLCVQQLAERLDQAFAKSDAAMHKGRRRLGQSAGLSMADLTQATPVKAPATSQDNHVATDGQKRPGNVLPFVRKAC